MMSVKCSWERAFWANARYLRNMKAPVDARLGMWRSIAFGIGDYYFAGWRPALKAASEIESAHNNILRRIIFVQSRQDDTAASFVLRRNSLIAHIKSRNKLCIRSRWAFRLVSWEEHLYRHQDSFAFKLLVAQDDEWLRIQRLLSGSPSVDAGTTGTRDGRGYPMRWGAGWLDAVGMACGGWENCDWDKTLTA